MSAPIIELDGVGKRHRQYHDAPALLSKRFGTLRRSARATIWALRDVDLIVEPRECVGVIGRNGGGKTTMLQLLARVTAPTEGRLRVRGTVAPLMAVGVGFHPELTGRENVYVNATILGAERSAIDASFADIVSFADIGDFIDTPVKFYSSGMMVRLGMAVAVRSQPDILLVDEVLAVGDLAFQTRCFERMQEMREAGTTIVFVSHNLDAVRILCERTVLLNEGRTAYVGDTAEAISRYHQLLDERREPEHEDSWHPMPSGSKPRLESLELLDERGERTSNVTGGEVAVAVITYRAESPPAPSPAIDVAVTTASGLSVYCERFELRGPTEGPDRPTSIEVRLPLLLPTGTYHLQVGLHDADAGAPASSGGSISFFVTGRAGVRGHADLAATFTVAETPAP